FFFSSRRRHTRFSRDWSSDVCSSDLPFTIGEIELNEWIDSGILSESRMLPGGIARRPGPLEVVAAKPAGDVDDFADEVQAGHAEIGRASCRERVESSGGAVTVRKKTR